MDDRSAARPEPPLAVLIDLDGTLLDTAPDLAEAVNRMRADLGLPALPLARIAAFVGKGAAVLIHRALTDDPEGKVDGPLYERGREAFFRHYHAVNGRETLVFAGVREGLRLLQARGLKLACVTNKPREFTVPLLERLGLADCFAAVVAGDDVRLAKPHPELLLAACQRLGVATGEAVMVGDSINDVQAARAAGMGTVLVETGYNEGEPAAELRAEPGVERVVPTLLQAAEYLSGRRS